MMTNADTDRLVKMISVFKDEIKDEFRHQLGIQTENFQHKLDLVVEGHQMLSEKLDIVKTELTQKIECVTRKLDVVAAKGDKTASKLDTLTAKVDAVAAKGDETVSKLDTLAAKVDAVAADIKAHRADTEAHYPVYRVKE
jgi:outer membrane murein-binding lipoprotein Lpp